MKVEIMEVEIMEVEIMNADVPFRRHRESSDAPQDAPQEEVVSPGSDDEATSPSPVVEDPSEAPVEAPAEPQENPVETPTTTETPPTPPVAEPPSDLTPTVLYTDTFKDPKPHGRVHTITVTENRDPVQMLKYHAFCTCGFESRSHNLHGFTGVSSFVQKHKDAHNG